MNRRTPLLSTWLLTAGLLVGGCSGGDDEARETTTTTSAPSMAPTTVPPAPTIDLTQRPARPATAEEAAAMVTRTERAIADPATTGDLLSWTAHEQQVAYRTIAEHPEWDAAVEQALPAELVPVAQPNVRAGRELRALVARPRAELPAWRIVPPRPADELRRYYEEGQARHGVPWQYLAAVNLVETRMGRLRGTSTAGARGPMQFIPSTWEAYGEGDIESDRDSILAAARYLAANGGGRGNLDNALYRYNPTPRYVNAVKAYAERMRQDERAYLAYHGWQVYFWSTLGDVWLRVGYHLDAPRPVAADDLR